jgi:trehalose-phosphatase
MRYIWAEWDRLRRTLLSKKEKLILLDFDGTLAPIARTPDAVTVDTEMHRVLKTLSRTPHTRLAVISGRSLQQLKGFLSLPKALYVGNHGLEMKGWSLVLPPNAKKARKLRDVIKRLVQKFKMTFNSYEGILVEDKHFTFSLHFRNLPKEQYANFQALVRFYRDRYRRYPLTWTIGKKVWEVQPGVFWGKGDTVAYLLKRFPRAFPIAIGDDRADEQMFHALKDRGITIRVGYSKTSKAKYYLGSPYDVKVFLKKLCP